MTPYDPRLPGGVEGRAAGDLAAWQSSARPRTSVLLWLEGSFATCLAHVMSQRQLINSAPDLDI